MSEFSLLLNELSSSAESLEDVSNVRALLHGDDSQLIFLVHPNEEGLFVVVEDASALGPEPIESSSFQILVALLEQEMVLDELVLVLLGHGSRE